MRAYGDTHTGGRIGLGSHHLMIQHWRKRGCRQRGLSLPEVLVASLIALIGFAALLSALLTGRFASARSQHLTQAVNVARARIEYLKSLSYGDLSSMPAVTTESGLVLDQSENGKFVPCERTTTLMQEQAGITIAVVVSWAERRAGAGPIPWTYDLKTWVGSPGRPSAP